MRELLLTNSRLDKRYDIRERLGQGSYAEIFVARDVLAAPSSPHNLVVIKALNVFLQNDLDPDLERTLVENFQNEAVALDRVRHPNIISRLGHGTARDLAGTLFHYLVLEYLAGGDLQKAAREEKPTLGTALRYVEQVCAGLRHAHRHGIIHRDIKPHNLLLTKDRETIKIADFGVARIHLNDAPITRVGTNVYAPPEHSPLHSETVGNGRGALLTPAADIYSLAKSVYTLVTGEPPRLFSGHQITALPPAVSDKEWATELLSVIRRATEDDPWLRHQSIDEFWAELEPVRLIAAESGKTGAVPPSMNAAPQPHVSKGYTPLAPRQPRFDTSRELKLRNPLILQDAYPTVSVGVQTGPTTGFSAAEFVEEHAPAGLPAQDADLGSPDHANQILLPPRRRKRFFRKAATFAFALVLFAGVLYATSIYLRGFGVLQQIANPFAAQTGRANTDINLRPDPSVNNEPLGLVTRNSRVRIVKIQNNWYQVDVIEQGRQREQPLPTNRGWLNGKYIDLD